MSNKLKKIKEINDVLGDEPKVHKKKSIVLLESIEENIMKSRLFDKKSSEDTLSSLGKLKEAIDNNDVSKDIFNDLIDAIEKMVKIIIGKKEFDDTKIVGELKSILKEVREIEFPTSIEVSNQKEFPKDINVSNFPKQEEFPTEINVGNFPNEIKISNQPTEIKVTNLKETPTEIKVSNFPEQKEQFKVTNLDEINKVIEDGNKKIVKSVDGIKIPTKVKVSIPTKPSWFKQFNVTDFISKIGDLFKNTLFKAEVPVHERPDRAIAVKLTDSKGKIIDQLIPHINVQPTGGTPDPLGIGNIAGDQINPATSDNQTNGDQITMIKDGKGGGHLAEVNDENQLIVKAASESMISHRSHADSTAYGISTPMLTITTTGGRILYIKNINSTKNFYLTDVWFSWNGGSTSHNRVMFGDMYFADAVPTTNITTGTPGVLNRGSNNSADLTFIYWDEVGDGMTGGSGGDRAFSWCNSQGHNRVPVQGAIILGVNTTVGINLKGEEIGEASINMFGYFE